MSKKIIQAKNINFSYGRHQVLEDVGFSVEAGDFLGIIGPNGGGKTTLLKILLGLLEPQSGSLEIFGKSPAAARDHIAYLPQTSRLNLDQPISVREVVLSGRLGYKKIWQNYSNQDKELAKTAMQDVNILDLQHQPMSKLSGGQKQRVLIARALVRRADLLLLDEPTNNIDPQTGQNLYDLLKKISQNRTVLLVSHDVVAISPFINKVFFINRQVVCHDHPGVCQEIIAEGYGHKAGLRGKSLQKHK